MGIYNIEESVRELAEQVVPENMLEGILSVPLEARLTGIAFFAEIAGESSVRYKCLAEVQVLQGL